METKKSHLTFLPGISGLIAFICGLILAVYGFFFSSSFCFLVYGICFQILGSQGRSGNPCPFEYLEAHKTLTVLYFSLERKELVLADEKGNSLFCKFPEIITDPEKIKVGSTLTTTGGGKVAFLDE